MGEYAIRLKIAKPGVGGSYLGGEVVIEFFELMGCLEKQGV